MLGEGWGGGGDGSFRCLVFQPNVKNVNDLSSDQKCNAPCLLSFPLSLAV